MYTCSQVALPIRENLPGMSAPVKAWNAGKAFALSAPMAHHTKSILTTPEAIKWTCSSASGLQYLTLAHLCMGRRKPDVHPVGVAVMPVRRGGSTLCLFPHDCCHGKASLRCC